jgi:hypothetical protein
LKDKLRRRRITMETYDFMARVDKILKENSTDYTKVTHKCNLCNDEGRIPYYKKIGKIRYEYYAHCICEVGEAFAYEGRECKAKSDYRMPSIKEILAPEAIEETKQSSREKKYRIHEGRNSLRKTQLG